MKNSKETVRDMKTIMDEIESIQLSINTIDAAIDSTLGKSRGKIYFQGENFKLPLTEAGGECFQVGKKEFRLAINFLRRGLAEKKEHYQKTIKKLTVELNNDIRKLNAEQNLKS